jgi:hypothetical protein
MESHNPLWALLGNGDAYLVEAHRATLAAQAALGKVSQATAAMCRGELGSSLVLMSQAS